MPVVYFRLFYLWPILCSWVSITLGQLLAKLCQPVGHSCCTWARAWARVWTWTVNSIRACYCLGWGKLLFNAGAILCRFVSRLVNMFIVKVPTPADSLVDIVLRLRVSCLYWVFCLLLSVVHYQRWGFRYNNHVIDRWTHTQLYTKLVFFVLSRVTLFKDLGFEKITKARTSYKIFMIILATMSTHSTYILFFSRLFDFSMFKLYVFNINCIRVINYLWCGQVLVYLIGCIVGILRISMTSRDGFTFSQTL